MDRLLKADEVQEILQKEMTRKQFLMHAGIALVAVTGIPALLRSLSTTFGTSKSVEQAGAYGFSGYSGISNGSEPGGITSSLLR